MFAKWWNENKKGILDFWISLLWFGLISSYSFIHGKQIDVIIGFYISIVCGMIQAYFQKVLWMISEKDSGKD